MNIGRKYMTKFLFIKRLLLISFFCWFSMNLNYNVFAQTNNNNAYSEKSIVVKTLNAEDLDSDQENISREAMAMIKEITNSNILYEKNKSSANLAVKEQTLKDREKQKKEMKEYNEKYNKKYLESFKRFQKMRGQHAGYTGVHSDYSDYLQQFLASTSR